MSYLIMKSLKRNIIISMSLGILSFIAMVFSLLALIDISNGEADLNLEWKVLRVSALIYLMFFSFTVITFLKILKKLK